MSHEQYSACIDACYDCAAACDHCSTACLREPDPAMMADVFALIWIVLRPAALPPLRWLVVAILPHKSVAFAPTFVMPVARSVRSMNLIIANSVLKLAGRAQKNAVKWQHKHR